MILEPAMVPISEGNISLRDDRKKTCWEVHVASFLLGCCPVTQAEYESVMMSNPSAMKGARRPVEQVSWEDAVAFCNALSHATGLTPCYQSTEEGVRWDPLATGYRLPTDAEWEYACRAGGGVRHGALEEIAWCDVNAQGRTHDVGQLAPNAWGLYDMLGNVWEWCWDVYDAEVYKTYRVFRGGGWADAERGCLASNRRRSHPTYRMDDLGFRIARSLGGASSF